MGSFCFALAGNGKLTLKGYPKLKTLFMCGVGLDKIDIDCPELENLYLTGNKLGGELDLTKSPKLVNLSVGKNSITKIIGLDKLVNLKDLRCNHNRLSNLDVSKLKNLEQLDASFCDMTEIKLGDNLLLWSLDLGENNIKNLDFPYLPSLLMLSLRENLVIYRLNGQTPPGAILTLRSPKLTFLDYHLSNIKKIFFHPDYPLENPNQLRICNTASYTDPDGTYNPDAATEWEKIVYEYTEKRKQEQESSPNNLRTLTYANLSHHHYEEAIINGDLFDNNLELISLGNNFLKKITIKNCPKLKHLNVSHNALASLDDVIIENCGDFDRSTMLLHTNYHGQGESPENDPLGEAQTPWKNTENKPLKPLILDPTDQRYDIAHADFATKQFLYPKLFREVLANPDKYTALQMARFWPCRNNSDRIARDFMDEDLVARYRRLLYEKGHQHNQQALAQLFGKQEEPADQKQDPEPQAPTPQPQEPPGPAPTPEQPQPTPQSTELINTVIAKLQEALKTKEWSQIQEILNSLAKLADQATLEQKAIIEQLNQQAQQIKRQQQSATENPNEKEMSTSAVVAYTLVSVSFGLFLFTAWLNRKVNKLTKSKKRTRTN